jgi:hypothetical protein
MHQQKERFQERLHQVNLWGRGPREDVKQNDARVKTRRQGGPKVIVRNGRRAFASVRVENPEYYSLPLAGSLQDEESGSWRRFSCRY